MVITEDMFYYGFDSIHSNRYNDKLSIDDDVVLHFTNVAWALFSFSKGISKGQWW